MPRKKTGQQVEVGLWLEYLPELIDVYTAAYELIYHDGTALAIKLALDKIPLEDPEPYP